MVCPDERIEEPVELRCSTLHGVLKLHNGIHCVEVKCHHIRCTKGEAVSVFHYFSRETGALVDTVRFQDPGRRFK
ncbi:hypothetical protein SEA_LEOPARD_32 [Mycobacterium phage Leopard]|nr:hypothetical protein SEA_LEOPARD_32 [Mycobacterium phage Leopard]